MRHHYDIEYVDDSTKLHRFFKWPKYLKDGQGNIVWEVRCICGRNLWVIDSALPEWAVLHRLSPEIY